MIIVDEPVTTVDETLISVDETVITVDETVITVDETVETGTDVENTASKEADKDNDSNIEVEDQILESVRTNEPVPKSVDIPCIGCTSKNRDIKLLNEHVIESESQIDAQIEAFKTKLVEKEKEKQNLIREYENTISLKVKAMEKEKDKVVKNYEEILKDHSEELALSRNEVKKVVEKNVKLAEENKTLHGIIEANKDIEEELNLENDEVDLENDEVDLENDEVFAEQMITVNGIKYRRTNSPNQAESNKQTNESQDNLGAKTKSYKCTKCDDTFSTMGLLRRHSKQKHPLNAVFSQADQEEQTRQEITCTKCNFFCETNDMLKQHVEKDHLTRQEISCSRCNFLCETKDILKQHVEKEHIKYQRKRPCTFWLNGYCLYSDEECRFSHEEPEMDQNTICSYGMNCRKTNCVFNHPKPCHFQQNCRNSNCRFWHFNQEYFLDLESVMEFPPLQPKSFKSWTQWF